MHLLQMHRFDPYIRRNQFSVCLGLHQEGTFRIAWSGASQHMQNHEHLQKSGHSVSG